MTKRVIIMNFELESQSYQAFSRVKRLAAEQKIKAEQMAVVSHTNDGQHNFTIEDFLDFTGNNKSATGGLIGMLVGILGGPIGILLGWFTGGMIGASQDVKEVKNAEGIFKFLIDKIGEGETGLILIADEEDNRPLNQVVMNELGGEITRLELAEVEEDIKKAQDLAQQKKAQAAGEKTADAPTDSDNEQ